MLDEARERCIALGELEAAAGEFEALAGALPDDGEDALRRTGAVFDALHACLARAEQAGCTREAILRRVTEVRRVLRRSPLLARMQTWPRGHRGDFETVDRLLGGAPVSAATGDIAWHCELHARMSPLVTQHRNRRTFAVAEIARELRCNGSVLVLGAGSGSEVADALAMVGMSESRIVVQDIDPEALVAARRRIGPAARRCRFVVGNPLVAIRDIEAAGPYTLAVSRALFEHLPDAAAAPLLGRLRQTLEVAGEGSRLCFANLRAGNSYGVLLRCLTEWRIEERSEDAIRSLLARAGFDPGAISVSPDATGLAWLVTARVVSTSGHPRDGGSG